MAEENQGIIHQKARKKFDEIIKSIKNESFEEELDIENYTVLIDGKFGVGKTTFLKDILGCHGKRFNRHFHDVENKKLVIHISPWNKDIKHDLAHYLMNEIVNAKEYAKGNDKIFLGTRVFLQILILSSFVVFIYKILGDIIAPYIETHIIFLLLILFTKFIIVPILMLLAFYRCYKRSIFKFLDKYIYNFLILIKSKNSNYLFEYQYKEIKNALTRYSKEMNEVYIVVEDMDRVEKSVFDEFTMIYNGINEIVHDINKEKKENKIIPIICLDGEKLINDYTFYDIEKLFQFKVELVTDKNTMQEVVYDKLYRVLYNFPTKDINKIDCYLQKHYLANSQKENNKKYEKIKQELKDMEFTLNYRIINRFSIEINRVSKLEEIDLILEELLKIQKVEKVKEENNG